MQYTHLHNVPTPPDDMESIQEYSTSIPGCTFHVSKGTVVEFEGDTIVNAANVGGLGGGGVDGAITTAGGTELAHCRKQLIELEPGIRIYTGDAKVTLSGNDSYDYVVHAVGPNYNNYEDEKEADLLLSLAYENSMKEAKAIGSVSIAFSLISAGVFRGTKSIDHVLYIGMEAIKNNLYEGLEEVHMVGFSDKEVAALIKIAKLLKF